jgi:ferric-dicitrate binding protein FerR (iron transport regulator)
VLRCPNRLTITAEEGSTYELEGGSRTRGPTGASLSGRALLVETPNGVRRHFQIRTPQAVASVRGTIWAVDVAETQTSVFVQRGAVAVRRQNTRQAVTLHPGEGVDVTDEPGPLVVRRWPEERVRRLLARLGR